MVLFVCIMFYVTFVVRLPSYYKVFAYGDFANILDSTMVIVQAVALN